MHGIVDSAYGSKGGLYLAWKEGIQVELWSFGSTFIDVVIKGN